MPEVLFSIKLPDGTKRECYSPSTVVRDYFKTGEEMTMAEFCTRSRRALTAASERVAAKYGFACSSAMDQLAAIETWAHTYSSEATVQILHI